ncbi:hypothetical protein PRIPAC_91481 [Pristionchus pacificus]|uniref:Uncharacterized protein n=1 Tax=Pristionchus pacificus TaxID=54126 RepID=A0A2A6BWB0_PRIPA|nr:hypothetical protein PRIPAC_91481 [Pristionchus pacificus]|eukprot:PDM70200.1 hypothetical protein PRIPAC_45551 [Pristionchus pacificus]
MPMQAGLVTNSSSLKTPAHTRRFGFDLQWDAICVKLCQHSYRKPREQDSFSSHCDCDKKKKTNPLARALTMSILKEEGPSDTHLDQRPESDTHKYCIVLIPLSPGKGGEFEQRI